MYNGNTGMGASYESSGMDSPISYNSESFESAYNDNSPAVSYNSNSPALAQKDEEMSEFDEMVEEETPKYSKNNVQDDLHKPSSVTEQFSGQNFFLNKELQEKQNSKKEEKSEPIESIEEMISKAIENAVSK